MYAAIVRVSDLHALDAQPVMLFHQLAQSLMDSRVGVDVDQKRRGATAIVPFPLRKASPSEGAFVNVRPLEGREVRGRRVRLVGVNRAEPRGRAGD